MTGGLPAWARSAATLRLLVQVGVLGLAGACHSTGPASEASSDSAAHGAHGARLGEGADSAVAAGSEAQSAAASGDLDDGEPLQLEVPVEGAFPLLVWAPKGTRPHAVIVSAHGAGCLAEQHCGYLWRLARGRAIVACLRGEPLFRARPEQGFYFRDHLALGKELQLAVHALKKQFGERLGASWTFVGYSQGATMGALALPDSPVAFDQIVFIEGGGEGMTRRSMEHLRGKGVQRVLFACGTAGCAKRSRETAGALGSVGIDARAVDAPGAGHTYLGAVEEQIAGELGWLWP